MQAREMGWQLQKTLVEDKAFFHEWVNRGETVRITYDERASVAEAAAWLEERPRVVSAPGGQPIAGVGDGALIWSGLSATGSATIYFRKGKATPALVREGTRSGPSH